MLNKKVAILGGSNMIGVELAKQLLLKNPGQISVYDNLSTGKKEWLPKEVDFYNVDLRNPVAANRAVWGADYVFLLACAHGGRGYVSAHTTQLYDNFSISATVLNACRLQKIGRIIVTSSACVYPTKIQMNIYEDVKLREDLVDYNNIQQADGMYGIEKLLLEHGLQAHVKEGNFEAVICRLFTVYDYHVSLTHAVGAMMAKFMLRQNPIEIWGNGLQKRNWTYCEDTVRGLILAAENGSNGGVYNIGTEEANTPLSLFEYLKEITGFQAEYKLLEDKPVGPYNRVADGKLAYNELGWIPEYTFKHGLTKTWFQFNQLHTVDELGKNFERKLTEI